MNNLNRNKNKNNIIVLVLFMMMAATMFSLFNTQATKTISIKEFESIVDKYDMNETVISPRLNVINVSGTYKKDGRIHQFEVRYPHSEGKIEELTNTLKEKDSTLMISDPFEPSTFKDYILPLIPYVLVLGVMFMMMSRAGGGNNKAFNFGESKAKIQGNVKVRFDDVAGADEEKE